MRQNPADLGQKSSEKWANFPPFTLPLVVFDNFPLKKWLFFQRKILRRSALRLGSESGATDSS